jgi:hypothetical protein
MEVEKLFRPSRWFVYFCGLLVLVWLALQSVSHARLSAEAKEEGTRLFTWKWSQLGANSQAAITEVKVLHKGEADAIVQIKGRQTLTVGGAGNKAPDNGGNREVVDCGATLSFYKSSNKWLLGKVELQ